MTNVLTKGSIWRRWDPHIHDPETLLNNQFKGEDKWENYLSRIENAEPAIEVLGITEYYLLDAYRRVKEHKGRDRLADVSLIFPNVELRLDVMAKKGYVNIHLLVDPKQPDHIDETKRFLELLQFKAHDDTFKCRRDDLIRLGKKTKPDLTNDSTALSHGVTQFRVSFSQLRSVYHENAWARSNILIAVAGGSNDGSSGLNQAADTTVRAEIEKFAHVIFSSNPGQRDFWTGQTVTATVDDLKERYDGCKPCLHGSDSHEQEKVANPDLSRYCWMKGAPEFDTLRQACIDPEHRAYVGEEPPNGALSSQIISNLTIEDADWAQTKRIPLNSGLVAIIGARGSGKTALADMIAAGCDAVPLSTWRDDEEINSPSFLRRAYPLVADAKAILNWDNGDEVARSLDGRDSSGTAAYDRARYLSQQFVEELCSSTGLSDGLVQEIERVVFQAHDLEATDDATNFEELREQKTFLYQQARAREEAVIADLSDRIAAEYENQTKVVKLSADVEKKETQLANLVADRNKLKLTGSEKHINRHSDLTQAAELVHRRVQAFGEQRRTFVALQAEVKGTRDSTAPEVLREIKERFSRGNLDEKQWREFLLIFSGDVDKSLINYITWADKEIGKLNGPLIEIEDNSKPLIQDDADLTQQTLNSLNAETKRLGNFITADGKIRKQYQALTTKIKTETAALEKLKQQLKTAEGAADRIAELQEDREACYGRIFQAIVNEQKTLEEIYKPLLRRLAESDDTLGKLGFSVERIVDVDTWGEFGEKNLFDRRKKGDTQGVGSLTKLGHETLGPAWKNGSAEDIQATMKAFMSERIKQLLSHAPIERSEQAEYRNWLNRFANWLFATDHITIRYEINYDGVDIRNLSPGTRGIVLLLLYLALDDNDARPLIIDQPEENLDPKSVNDELVPLFIEAKSRRQVIMVTHNANLVVNTDADQIIIAEAGPHPEGGLPPITYRGGGLETKEIRDDVCLILEGGEPAFQDRARRLRVKLDR